MLVIAGIGVITLEGAPLALHSFATARLKKNLCGRWLGVCFLLVMVGSCTKSFYTLIKERILMLRSLL